MRALTLLLTAGFFSTLAVCYAQSLATQKSTSEESLNRIVSSLDKELFDAVNSCDIAKLRSFWAEDAEFLHDRASPTYGREAIVSSIQKNLCGNVQRELVPGSMEVYELKDYGAVEIGVHRFLHPGAKDHGVIGEAKFIHVWEHFPDGWKITRVISYEHGTVDKH
jgi:ketosteroid isomerase-like protein